MVLRSLRWEPVVTVVHLFSPPVTLRLDLLIKKEKEGKNNIMRLPNASLGGDEWGQSYYSFELLQRGGEGSRHLKQHDVAGCYFLLFYSCARDL